MFTAPAFSEDGVTLPVARTSTDTHGSIQYHYAPLNLKNAKFSFMEESRYLNAESELVELSLDQDDYKKLQYFRLVLRAEPVQYRTALPGGQIAAYPVSNFTIYDDLNGDSVLDTMDQIRPDGTKSFILVENRWIQVTLTKEKWAYRKIVKSLSGDEFTFENGAWKTISHE